MNKCEIGFLTFAAIFLIVSAAYAKSGPMADDCSIYYEKRIHELSQALEDAGSLKRAVDEHKYAEFVREMNELDNNTQFQLCSDQDGSATLKFNTPEEQLRDSIASLLGWVGWFQQQAASIAAAPETDKVIGEVKTALGDMQSYVDKEKTKGLTDKGSFEQLVGEYQRLKTMREKSMQNLHNMADRYVCRGLTAEEMELAKLYHETIPFNKACNDLVRNALRDRIRRIRTIGFGTIFEPETYEQLKTSCPNPKPAAVFKKESEELKKAAKEKPAAAAKGEGDYVVWLHAGDVTCCPGDTNGEPNYAFHVTKADAVKEGAIVLKKFATQKEMKDWACGREISPHYWAGTYAKIDGYHVTRLPCSPNR